MSRRINGAAGRFSPAELAVLETLGRRGGCSQSELAAHTKRKLRDVADAVRNLVAAGLANGSQHPYDKRRWVYHITPDGADALLAEGARV